MDNGERLGLSLIAGGIACVITMLLFILGAVALTRNPPDPAWAFLNVNIGTSLGCFHWRHAYAIRRWMDRAPRPTDGE